MLCGISYASAHLLYSRDDALNMTPRFLVLKLTFGDRDNNHNACPRRMFRVEITRQNHHQGTPLNEVITEEVTPRLRSEKPGARYEKMGKIFQDDDDPQTEWIWNV